MGEQTDRLLLEVEFTHRWYRTFLERLRADDYDFRGFANAPAEGEVVLRHDVDLSLESALEMARIEAEVGVESTYFVLLTSPLYNALAPANREILRRIEGLGHDVGLHFSTHAYPELDRRPPTGAVASVPRSARGLAAPSDGLLRGARLRFARPLGVQRVGEHGEAGGGEDALDARGGDESDVEELVEDATGDGTGGDKADADGQGAQSGRTGPPVGAPGQIRQQRPEDQRRRFRQCEHKRRVECGVEHGDHSLQRERRSDPNTPSTLLTGWER